jgi:hypothetical protein
MQKYCATALGFAVVMTLSSPTQLRAEQAVTVGSKCIGSICGKSTYYGGRVRISLGSKLTRTTHYNFKTNPGDQIEIRGTYSFDQPPGRHGTYSAQACGTGGINNSGYLGRSTCTNWGTFRWSSGG